MIGTLERLLADITANREILESAMNFSLTVMTHRTNLTMNRLAVVSTIFLPLTFLCGVYGMNFEIMPETEWVHGYKMFWIVSAIITTTLTFVLRKARLLWNNFLLPLNFKRESRRLLFLNVLLRDKSPHLPLVLVVGIMLFSISYKNFAAYVNFPL